MDAWSSIIMVVNILLLIAGWLLFQQAKSDLTARAAQIPVLSEVKALQKSIAALLEQLKLESSQTSAQLEARCLEARDLLSALDRRVEDARESRPASKPSRRREASVAERPSPRSTTPEEPPVQESAGRYDAVYAMADEGASHSAIAQSTGYSEGEIDLILGLRRKVS
jgi:hypothetical protein